MLFTDHRLLGNPNILLSYPQLTVERVIILLSIIYRKLYTLNGPLCINQCTVMPPQCCCGDICKYENQGSTLISPHYHRGHVYYDNGDEEDEEAWRTEDEHDDDAAAYTEQVTAHISHVTTKIFRVSKHICYTTAITISAIPTWFNIQGQWSRIKTNAGYYDGSHQPLITIRLWLVSKSVFYYTHPFNTFSQQERAESLDT